MYVSLTYFIQGEKLGPNLMGPAKTIKSLFWELRAAGIDGSAKDVLRLAHFLLQSHHGEIRSSDEFGRIVDPRTLPLLAVDIAMKDGGWQVLAFENIRSTHVEREAYDYFLHRSRREKF